MKKRLLTILLGLAMLLSFMPAMAFAEELPEDTYAEWHIGTGDYNLVNGEAELEAKLWMNDDPDMEFSPVNPTYQWYKEDNEDEGKSDWIIIEDATDSIYTATEAGCYACVVKDGDEVQTGYFYVDAEDEEYWHIWISGDDQLEYGKTVKLEAVIEGYSGEGTPEYQWAKDISSNEEDEYNWDYIDGATENSLVISDIGTYCCFVTIDGKEEHETVTVEYDLEDYEWNILYPNATASYKTVDNRTLSIDLNNERDEWANFPLVGDVITVQNDSGETIKYTCNEKGFFVSEYDDDFISLNWDEDWDIDISGKKVKVVAESAEKIDHEAKIRELKYCIEFVLNANITSDVKSIVFSPNNIKVDSEAVKEVEDGHTYYFLENRFHHTDVDGEKYDSAFTNGDKVSVTYSDGTVKTYVFNANYGGFILGNPEDDEFYTFYIYPKDSSLKPGDNSVQFWSHGVSASIRVYMETPEMRAEAAKAAASNINKSTVTAADIKKASNLGATTVTLGPKVKKIKKNAFKGTKINTIVVKTKKLKAKSVKGSLKGSKVKTVKVEIGSKKVNKKYVKSYKKIFTKKNAGKKAKVK